MQGANYQVDKEPLLTIPLPNPETLDKNIEMNIIKLVEKYTVVLNRQTQSPADSYEKDYPDSYFLDIPNKIEKRKKITSI